MKPVIESNQRIWPVSARLVLSSGARFHRVGTGLLRKYTMSLREKCQHARDMQQDYCDNEDNEPKRTKHIPGPWEAQFVTTDDGLTRCQIIGSVKGPVGAQSALLVADLSIIGIKGVKGPAAFDKQSQANARLIAAAPELLEACQIACAYLEIDADDEIEKRDCATIRAAITKAKGGAL